MMGYATEETYNVVVGIESDPMLLMNAMGFTSWQLYRQDLIDGGVNMINGVDLLSPEICDFEMELFLNETIL